MPEWLLAAVTAANRTFDVITELWAAGQISL